MWLLNEIFNYTTPESKNVFIDNFTDITTIVEQLIS